MSKVEVKYGKKKKSTERPVPPKPEKCYTGEGHTFRYDTLGACWKCNECHPKPDKNEARDLQQ